MGISLRFVVALINAVIVVVVAAVTLTITYTVSLAAINDAAERLSGSISNTVSLQVGARTAVLEAQLRSWVDSSHIANFTLPVDTPGYATGDNWGIPTLAAMRVQQLHVNFSYSSIAMIYPDGSQIVTLVHPRMDGWITEGVQTWRRNGTQRYPTLLQYTFRMGTFQSWDYETMGAPERVVYAVSAFNSGFTTIDTILQNRPGCTYFPPSPDHNAYDEARYILYGICALYNASGVLISHIHIGLYLDEIPRLLAQTAKTPGTELFITDSMNQVLATTVSVPPVVFLEPNVSRAGYQNCISSRSISSGPEVFGCRKNTADYPYEPLQAALQRTPGFATVDGYIHHTGKLAGEKYFYISKRIPSSIRGYTMNLLLFMPASDVLGNIVVGRNLAIGVTVAVALVTIAAAAVLIGVLMRPMDEIVRRMYLTSKLTSDREITDLREAQPLNGGRYGYSNAEGEEVTDDGQSSIGRFKPRPADEAMPESRMTEIRSLQKAYSTMDTAIRSFSRYVPRDVVKELMATNQICELQMRPQNCSMLFADIVGFTSICERVPPPVLSSLVRQYFDAASRIVMGHGGVIDKFIGDCVMAVWGAPVPIDHNELRSAVCGRMLIYEVAQDALQSTFAKVDETLAIRVGVASGEVLAGNMGSEQRMNYTVIGDDVNLAARLESLNKQWGTQLLICESTAEECAEFLHMRYVISVAAVGKKEAVKVYEVLGAIEGANMDALGATSEASEQRSLTQVARDEIEIEMAAKYADGVDIDSAGGHRIFSCGKLLRRMARKLRVPAEEIAFAEVYAEILAAWNAGRFAEVVARVQALQNRQDHDLPSVSWTRQSVVNLLNRAERYAQDPKAVAAAGSWTGVWVATEK